MLTTQACQHLLFDNLALLAVELYSTRSNSFGCCCHLGEGSVRTPGADEEQLPEDVQGMVVAAGYVLLLRGLSVAPVLPLLLCSHHLGQQKGTVCHIVENCLSPLYSRGCVIIHPPYEQNILMNLHLLPMSSLYRYVQRPWNKYINRSSPSAPVIIHTWLMLILFSIIQVFFHVMISVGSRLKNTVAYY